MQETNKIFCNNNNISTNPSVARYEGYGNCCPIGSTDDRCIHGKNGVACTSGPLAIQGEPLYRTFWTGMTPAICNTTSFELEAKDTR